MSSKKKNVTEEEMEQSDKEEQPLSFDEMGLDDKILHSIASFGWNRPTLIQEKTIPLALEGKLYSEKSNDNTY